MSIHTNELPGKDPDALIPPNLAGRLFLLLKAVMQNRWASTDDACLPGERDGKRAGNVKLVGRAVAYAHQRKWIAPLFAENGRRYAVKSGRTCRASGPVELWQRTPTTAEALARIERQLGKRPPVLTLFDNC